MLEEPEAPEIVSDSGDSGEEEALKDIEGDFEIESPVSIESGEQLESSDAIASIEESGDRLDLVADLLGDLSDSSPVPPTSSDSVEKLEPPLVEEEPPVLQPWSGESPSASGSGDDFVPLEAPPNPWSHGESVEPLPEPLPAPEMNAGALQPPPASENISLELEFEPPVEADEIEALEAPKRAAPTNTEYAYSPGVELSSSEVPPLVEREPGEVTPLARIELVRAKTESVQSSEPAPLNIEEDSSTAIPSKRGRSAMPPKSARAMAIDMGTSRTWVAIVNDGEPCLVPSRRGTPSIPSIVLIQPDGKTIIGEPALRKMEVMPQYGVVGAKRLMGRPFRSPPLQQLLGRFDFELCAGEEGEVAVAIDRHRISLEEIFALIFKELRESVPLSLNERINRAVLTCPARFGHRQREGLRTAASLAGIHVERLICEPLAAAIHHALYDSEEPRLIFVYHLGAGTFDATLIQVQDGAFKVLETRGDYIGGADFDETIIKLLLTRLEEAEGRVQKPDLGQMVRLRRLAEQLKVQLSDQEEATAELSSLGGASFDVALDFKRPSVEYLWTSLIERTISMSADVLRAAGVEPSAVDDVLLIGAQTKAPKVRAMVEVFFEQPVCEIDPELAAVYGAAEAAARLGTPEELQLSELLTEPLCVGGPGGELKKVIERGVSLPVQRVFRVEEGQVQSSGGELFIYQGEGESLAEVELLGVLKLQGTEQLAGEVDVFFYVSQEGMLSLSAASLSTSESLVVELMPEQPAARKKGGFVDWLKKKLGVSSAPRP